MAYIKDYLQWRGDLTFSLNEINNVDILALSLIPLLDLDGIVPSPTEAKSIKVTDLISKYYEEKRPIQLGLIISEDYVNQILSYKNYPRYNDLEVSDYFNDIDLAKDMQCCGCVVKINDDLRIVCCSGTDDTIVGWKENLLMMYNPVISSEVRMQEYLQKMIKKYGGKFIVAGHSKGGRLAQISSATLDSNDYSHIERVIGFDSPGINDLSVYKDEVIERLKTMELFIPDSSIVGRNFSHIEKTTIIKSTNNGLYQHDPFSWKVLGTDFVIVSKCTKISDDLANIVHTTLDNMSNPQKHQFVNALISIFDENHITRLLEINNNKLSIIRSFRKMNKKDKKLLTNIFMKLSFYPSFRKTIFFFLIDNSKEAKKKKANNRNIK